MPDLVACSAGKRFPKTKVIEVEKVVVRVSDKRELTVASNCLLSEEPGLTMFQFILCAAN